MKARLSFSAGRSKHSMFKERGNNQMEISASVSSHAERPLKKDKEYWKIQNFSIGNSNRHHATSPSERKIKVTAL